MGKLGWGIVIVFDVLITKLTIFLIIWTKEWLYIYEELMFLLIWSICDENFLSWE